MDFFQTPGSPCDCGRGGLVLEPVQYETGFAGIGTYNPGCCATCADESIASDLYKDEYGIRPRMASEDLLAWYAGHKARNA